MHQIEQQDNDLDKSETKQSQIQFIEEFITLLSKYLDPTKLSILRNLIQEHSIIGEQISLIRTIEEQYPIQVTNKIVQDKIALHKMSLLQITQYFQLQYQLHSQIIHKDNLKNFQILQLNKSVYYGEIINGLKHGKGIILNSNGSFYEGEFQSDFKSGRGFEVLKNSDCYYGDFLNGIPNGSGVVNYKNSEIYIGQWLNGKKNGIGYWTSTIGPFYIGEWNQGQAEGKGLHSWITGEIYFGEMRNNLKHGQGIEYFNNGDYYEGNYGNGKPNGYGLYRWVNGSQYAGDFVNGLRHGNGQWVRNQYIHTSDNYEGEFCNDKKSGKGRYVWANGTVYEGEFYNDKRNGQGQIQWNDGANYIGEWQDGLINGIGEFSQDGQSLKGVWKQNQLAIQQINSISITRISLTEFPKTHIIRNETVQQDKRKEKYQIYAEDYINDRAIIKLQQQNQVIHNDESTRDITSNYTKEFRKENLGMDRNRKSKSLSRQKGKNQNNLLFQSQISKSNQQSQNLYLNQSSLNESEIIFNQQQKPRVAHKSIQVIEMKDKMIQTNFFNSRYQQPNYMKAPLSPSKKDKFTQNYFIEGAQLGNIDEEITMENNKFNPQYTNRKNISHSPKKTNIIKNQNIRQIGQNFLTKHEIKLWQIKMDKLKLNPLRYDDLWNMEVVKRIRQYIHPKVWVPSVRHQYHYLG